MAFVPTSPRRSWWPFVKQMPVKAPAPAAEAAFAAVVAFDRTAEQMLREYHRSIYLWRCVDMIAQMSSSIVLDVRPTSNRDLSEDERAIDRLVKYPNPQWPGAALQYFVTRLARGREPRVPEKGRRRW